LGKVLDIKLWGFQAPPGGCYFGKGCGYRAFGILASIMGKVVDIVGLLGFLASQRLVFWERYLGRRAFRIFGPSPWPTNLRIRPQIRKALYIGNLLY